MSLASIDELITSITPDDAKAKLYQIADTIGLVTTAWQKLSPLRSVFGVLAFAFSGLSRAQAEANRGGFLETAVGGWLKNRAKSNYDVDYIPATFAVGPVSVSNAGGGLYSFGVGDLVVLNTAKGKTYANTAPVTINPLASGVVVQVEALEAGTASNATVGQIDAIVAGSPQLSVTNLAAVLGEDDEDEDALRGRCTDKLGAISIGGPAKAIAYIVKTPALNGGVAGLRVLVRPAEGNGTIRVVIAGPSGPVSGTTGDPTSDLGKVFLALNQLAVVSGYTLLLSSATAKNISADATVYIATSSGLSSGSAIFHAQQAIEAYVPTIPIGGVDVGAGGSVLYRALETVIQQSSPGILEAKLASEVDIALGPTEVAVLTSEAITPQQVNA